MSKTPPELAEPREQITQLLHEFVGIFDGGLLFTHSMAFLPVYRSLRELRVYRSLRELRVRRSLRELRVRRSLRERTQAMTPDTAVPIQHAPAKRSPWRT
jgi:hypothetical protein